jgi:hypothetical protein
VNSAAVAALQPQRPARRGHRRRRKGHIGQHIEQVAVLGLDDLLHLGQRLAAEALVGQAGEQRLAGVGSLQSLRSSSSSLKNSGRAPNSASRNCAADIGRPSALQNVVAVMCWIVRLAVGQLHLDACARTDGGARPRGGQAGPAVSGSTAVPGAALVGYSGPSARRPTRGH